MVRTSFKVLVLPYWRSSSGQIEYAVFKKGEDYWQGIAGGVEGGESPLDAARREAMEEGGIQPNAGFSALDTVSGFPFNNRVITQYAFAVELNDKAVRLSEEHSEYRWLPFDEAWRTLKWDGDRAALTELNTVLMSGRRHPVSET